MTHTREELVQLLDKLCALDIHKVYLFADVLLKNHSA